MVKQKGKFAYKAVPEGKSSKKKKRCAGWVDTSARVDSQPAPPTPGPSQPTASTRPSPAVDPSYSVPTATGNQQAQSHPLDWRATARSSTSNVPVSNKRLLPDEYTRGRIIQISKLRRQAEGEGWRGHPGVILGKWGQRVAVGMTSTWGKDHGRDIKFGGIEDVKVRERKLRFFPVLKHAADLHHDRYGMLTWTGARNIFQTKSWFDYRGVRVVWEWQLERYVEKGTTDQEACLDQASMEEIERFWDNIVDGHSLQEVMDSGDFPWNREGLASILRYQEAKRTGVLSEEDWT